MNKLSGMAGHIDELIKEVEGKIKDSGRLEKPKKGKWYLAPLLAALAGAGAYYAYDFLSQKASQQISLPVQQAAKQAIPAPINVPVQRIASKIPPNRRVADISHQDIDSSRWNEERPSIAVVPPSSPQLLPLKPNMVAPAGLRKIVNRETKSIRPYVPPLNPAATQLQPPTPPKAEQNAGGAGSSYVLPQQASPLQPYTAAKNGQRPIVKYPSRLGTERKPAIKEYPSRSPSKEIKRKVESITGSPPGFSPTSFMRISSQRQEYPASGARSVQPLYRQPAGKPYGAAANNIHNPNGNYQKIIQKKQR